MQRQQGLTLLELMVVLLIMGLVITTASLALRDSAQTQLEREAQRLVAKLEAARAQSRTSGQTMVWQPSEVGFVIGFLPQAPQTTALQETWLQAGTQASIDFPQGTAANVGVVLGPEPVLSPIQISLRLGSAKSADSATRTLRIGTDGLRPFEVLP